MDALAIAKGDAAMPHPTRAQLVLPGFGKHRRVCPECAEEYTTDKVDQSFCGASCKADFHNRSSKIGRVLVPLAQAWRAGRNAKGGTAKARALRASAARAFGDMCAAIDAANADDNKAGRMPKLDYLRDRARRSGTLRPEEKVAVQEAKIAKLERELAKAKRELEAAK